jgi:hypothetical protein
MVRKYRCVGYLVSSFRTKVLMFIADIVVLDANLDVTHLGQHQRLHQAHLLAPMDTVARY